MKSIFAAAILFAAAYAMEEEVAAEETEVAEEVVGPVKTAWVAPTATKSLNALSGNYWTVEGLEGAHSLYVSISGVTDATQAFPANYWIYNYFAVQRPATQPAAVRRLADEAAAEEEVAAMDSVWDAFTCGQKFKAVDGADAVVADAADRAGYNAAFAYDRVFDAATYTSAQYIAQFNADGVARGSFVHDGEPTQARSGKQYMSEETIMRPFAGSASTFEFKGGETLNVRVGSKGFSANTYYGWRANDFPIIVLDSATALAAGAVALTAALAF